MTRRHASSRPQPLAEVPGWDFDAEVIVVGFGAAGASAAIQAADAGARVALFEVASGSGGTSALASGYIYFGGNGGTPAQRDNGFEDTTEDFYRYMMLAGGPDADEARVRLYADNALDHYHWLEAQGVHFRNTYLPGKRETPQTGDCLIWSGNEDAWPFNLAARPCPRGHLPEAPGELGGKRLVDTLARRVEALEVEVHFDARVTALVADEASRVHGVVVQVGGQQRFARARKGVILCAGGFVLNQSMLQQYAPSAARLGADSLSAGHDDGSGISMGLSVGAAAIHMDELFTTLQIYPPVSHVKGILINERGQRFVNEDAYPGRVSAYCTRQPGDRIFLLVDDAIFAQPSELSRIEVAAVGESWESLERELGMREGSLVSSVESYNLQAARGEDPFFHKAAKWLKPLDEPPFAALACHIGQAFYPFFTLGGLRTLPTGEVLTANGEIVAGLYAAGRNCCGLPRSAEGYSSGMSLGDCTFFGRLAGRSAAESEPTARLPAERMRSEP
jgi:succinate dehydrogenase/fumarate reductase flavoprotein subunit